MKDGTDGVVPAGADAEKKGEDSEAACWRGLRSSLLTEGSLQSGSLGLGGAAPVGTGLGRAAPAEVACLRAKSLSASQDEQFSV